MRITDPTSPLPVSEILIVKVSVVVAFAKVTVTAVAVETKVGNVKVLVVLLLAIEAAKLAVPEAPVTVKICDPATF